MSAKELLKMEAIRFEDELGHLVNRYLFDGLSGETIKRILNRRCAAESAEPVAWRWRTLPKFSEDAIDQKWVLADAPPDFINPHHHEVEPLKVVDRPSNQEIFCQGNIAGWNAKEGGQPAVPADAQVPVAWIAFAGTGNVRFWTSDERRAKEERARGLDLRAFTLAELVALAAKHPAEIESL